MERMTVLEAVGVCVDRGRRRTLSDASMQARAGQVTALVGPNGAGKSTLLHVLAGTLAPSQGAARWMGHALPDMARLACERALVEQRSEPAFGWSVEELVALGRLPHRLDAREVARDAGAVERAVEAVGLGEALDRPAWELSGGEQQRAQIARALAQLDSLSGRALLLDEPTASLDWASAAMIYQLVRGVAARGLAVVIVLHDLQAAAQIADQVVLMARGEIVCAGPPAQALSAESVSETFGITLSGADLVPDFLAPVVGRRGATR